MPEEVLFLKGRELGPQQRFILSGDWRIHTSGGKVTQQELGLFASEGLHFLCEGVGSHLLRAAVIEWDVSRQ